jgi:hypothetical protein
MSIIGRIIEEIAHKVKLLPGVRQTHTRLLRTYIPDDAAIEALRNALFEWKYSK